MLRSPFRTAAALVLLAGCDEAGLGALEGQVSVAEVLDFGPVPLGSTAVLPLAIEVQGGLAFEALGATLGDARAPFSLGAVPERMTAADANEVDVSFIPTGTGSFVTSLTLELRPFGRSEVIEKRVELRGEGVPLAIEVAPNPLDFGAVRLGDARTLELAVTNVLPEPIPLLVGVDARGVPLVEGPGTVFQILDALGPDGAVTETLEPGEVAKLSVEMRPNGEGNFAGSFRLAWCEGFEGCSTRVRLLGSGVRTALACTPPILEFGSVRPGGAKRRTVECTNPTHRALRLSGPVLGGPDADRFSLADMLSRLDAGASVEVEVELSPLESDEGQTLLGSADIIAEDASGHSESVQVVLRGFVEQAGLTALPNPVSFGRVALGLQSFRSLDLVNVGSRSVTLSEVVIPAPFTGGHGRFVLAPGASLTVPIELTATQVGTLAGSIEVHVEDEELQDLSIPVSAEALNLPPCRISVSPGTIDFGLVDVSSMTQRGVILENTASFDCLLRDASASGSGFGVVPSSATDVVIPPGGRHRLDASFSPEMSGESRGLLRFQVSDLIQPTRSVVLSGTAGVSEIRVDPTRLDFGNVRPDCGGATRTARILNYGSAPARITTVQSSNAEFSIVNPAPGLPAPPGSGLTLGGGAAVDVQVHFRPTAYGPAPIAELRVESAGMSAPRFVDLVGFGSEANAEEVFQQTPAAEVDVLFVIDDSASMAREQAFVIANAGAFLDRLDQAGADFHVSVISTNFRACPVPTAQRDPSVAQGACGWFADGNDRVSNPAWTVVDPRESPSPQEAFAQILDVGLNGLAEERGLEAAYRALSPLYLSGHNAGFLRPQANLSVIFISDEEDLSSRSPELYSAHLRSLKSDPTRVSVSAILSTGVACAQNLRYRYHTLVEEHAGLIGSICEPDWSDLVRALADRALGLRTEFRLTGDANPSTLRVEVDGVEVPAHSASAPGWSYDPSTRGLFFHSGAEPASGATIRVSYAPECPSL